MMFCQTNCNWDNSTLTVVRSNSTNKIYLLLLDKKVKRIIPDNETVQFFEYNPHSLTEVDETYLDTFKNRSPVISLLTSRRNTPDERMRNYIHTIKAVHEPTFWKDEYFLDGLGNPSITFVGKKKEFLLSWRIFDDKTLKFGWLKLGDNRTYSNYSMSTDLGLGPDNDFLVQKQDFNYDQQDPRLLIENETTIVISYSIFLGSRPNGLFKQSMVRLRIDEEKAIFSKSSLLESTELFKNEQHQKNWIPFIYEKRLLFVQSICPFHVIELVNEENIRPEVKSVVKNNTTDLPWKGWHGWPLRGGTPAILVRGVYLSFFHVIFMFQFPYKMRTYFMGALTFCPTPPFPFHSMSSHPIIREALYQGPWINIKMDYVVFPTGITLDPDGKHLWLSFGWQDKHGWLVKMEIDELLSSLTIISECV